MKTCVSTAPIESIVGRVEAVRLIARGGYDSLDFGLGRLVNDNDPWSGDGYREEAARVLAACKESGIHVGQTHAPFTFRWFDDDAYEKVALPRTVRAIEITALLESPIIVVHPLHHWDYRDYSEMMIEKNIEFYRTLLPYAKKFGVKIALENMFQRDYYGHAERDMYADAEEFKNALDTLNDPQFCACVDVGHCALGGGVKPGDMIRILGPYVQCLHLHDNDGVMDTHTIPLLGDMTLDWDDICAALKEIGYRDELDMELGDNYFKRFRDPELLVRAVSFANDIGKYLGRKIEG